MSKNETAGVFAEQKALLERFDNQVNWVCWSVAESFGLPNHGLNVDDLREEAIVLVITYAGYNDEASDGSKRLAKWIKDANGDDDQVQHFLARQLRIDLSRIVGRYLKDETDLVSLSNPNLENVLAGLDMEDVVIDRADRERESRSVRKSYPTFARSVLDGLTQEEIAAELKVTSRTVRNRITTEKRAYLIDFVTRHGLCCEGDETIGELVEAYNNLRKGSLGRGYK
jgi:hypothetical protein